MVLKTSLFLMWYVKNPPQTKDIEHFFMTFHIGSHAFTSPGVCQLWMTPILKVFRLIFECTLCLFWL